MLSRMSASRSPAPRSPSTDPLSPAPRARPSLRSVFRSSPALPFQLAALVVLLVLASSEAGYYPSGGESRTPIGWYPMALLVLVLLAAALVAVPPRRPDRLTSAALGLLAGFAAWCYLSILWAEVPGEAWDGANRAAAFAVVFALFSLWPLRPAAARSLVALLGLGLALLGLVELLRMDGSANPAGYFIGGRFAQPTGYVNTNVAVWSLGALACAATATRREGAPLLRGLALGGAVVLALLALMSQSRGWFIAMPIGALALVGLSPYRLRALLTVLAVGLATLAVSGPVLALYGRFGEEPLDGLVASATRAVLVAAVVAALAGALVALADRRKQVPRRIAHRAGVATAVAAAVVVVAGLGAVAVTDGVPPKRLERAWAQFKEGGSPVQGENRLATLGTNRYDFWTVALATFGDHPLRGIGAENFQRAYLREGKSGEQPRFPHSLPLGVLAQTGLVGAILLFGGLGAALAAAGRRLRRSGPRAEVAGAATAVFAYWLVHASIDWFWEFFALSGLALAMLAVGAAAARAPAAARREALPSRTGIALAVGGVAGGVLLALSLLAPWMADRQLQVGATDWEKRPSEALRALDRAAQLDPLSADAALTAATIALRRQDGRLAIAEFGKALRRDPTNDYALLMLGALASERGDRARATGFLGRALAQSPRDELTREALQRVQSGATVSPSTLASGLLKRARERVE